jgi:hypothetical protein
MNSLVDRTIRTARTVFHLAAATALPTLLLLGAIVAGPVTAMADGTSTPDAALLGALKGSELHPAALGALRAQGVLIQNATNNGGVTGTVDGKSVTGMVSANNSINGNAGITTVFQNSGNNALIQNTMTINVTMH